MSSDPPPWAAEPRRSTRKRSAATQSDLELDVSDTETNAGDVASRGLGCTSVEIRDPPRPKRQRRTAQEKDEGGLKSSGCSCSRKRHLQDEAMGPLVKRKKVQHCATLYLENLNCEVAVGYSEKDVKEFLFGSSNVLLANLEEPSEVPFDISLVSREAKSQSLQDKKAPGKKPPAGASALAPVSAVDAYQKVFSSIAEFSGFGRLFKVDTSSGEVDEDGVEDGSQMEDLEIVPADYMLRIAISNFRIALENMGPESEHESELVDEYGIGARESLAEAVSAVTDILGMQPCEAEPYLTAGSLRMAVIMHKIAHSDILPSPQEKSACSAHAGWCSRDFEFKPHLNSSSRSLPPAMSDSKNHEHSMQNQVNVSSALSQPVSTECWRKYGQKVVKGSPNPRRPWEHVRWAGIRNLLHSKCQCRAEEEEEQAKGGVKPYGSVYSRKRAVQEEGIGRFVKRTNVNNFEQNKLRMSPCQFFVNVGGFRISMQKYLNKTTVKMLAKYVQDRVGANVNDFYCTYAGKCLNEERLLSYYHIQRDSTIMVQHRLRGGVREQTIECLNWESAIDGIPRFHTVALPPDFVDAGTNRATAKYLSEAIQERSCQVLIALCEVHLRNFSLDGNFGPEHILFYKGRVFFDDAVREVRFSPVKGRRDYSRVFDIFLPVFRDEANPDDFPLHSPDLLDFLFDCPPNFDLRSLTVVAYLINHSAIQTYTERISTCKTLESMVTRLFGIQLWRFQHLISHPDWLPIQNVPALHARYMYDPIWNEVMHEFVSKYGNDCRECLKLADNYFKHANDNIHMEVVEAAFSLAMSEDNFMPRLLQTLAALDPPLQDPRFDVVKVFGTHRVSCRPLQVAN